jgi:uncharacterized membrane protein
VVAEDVRRMSRRHGYAAYAVLGALTGAAMMAGYQVGPLSSPPAMVAGAVVGALFGAALRDAL